MTEKIAIILLDPISRKFVNSNIMDTVVRGVEIINNLNEITKEMVQECPNVIVFESFIQNSYGYADLKLFKAILNIKYTFIGVNDDTLDTLKEYGNTFRCSLDEVDFDIIQSAIFQDFAAEDNSASVNGYNGNLRFAENILSNEHNFDENIVNLAREYTSNLFEWMKDRDSLKLLKNKFQHLNTVNDKLQTENSILVEGFQGLIQDAAKLNGNIKEYEKIMSRDIYEKIDATKYPNRPLIIYLKEFEELIHENSFIETLYEMLRFQGRNSVKVLRLYDGSNCRKVKVLPDYYYRMRNQFLVSDVIANDFLVKVGAYNDVLDIILNNKTGLDVLVIIDCKSMDDVIMSNASLYLNLCRSSNNVVAYGLDYANTVINGVEQEDYLVWSHYTELSQIDSKETKFLFLASRPVMRTIYDSFRLVSTSI
jgi:hypothetical protein